MTTHDTGFFIQLDERLKAAARESCYEHRGTYYSGAAGGFVTCQGCARFRAGALWMLQAAKEAADASKEEVKA